MLLNLQQNGIYVLFKKQFKRIIRIYTKIIKFK